MLYRLGIEGSLGPDSMGTGTQGSSWALTVEGSDEFPPGKLGRNDSQIGRSSIAKLYTAFSVSLEAN